MPNPVTGTPLVYTTYGSAPIYSTAVVAGGGTSVTSVTTAPAATAFAGWDSNKNLSANSFIEGYRTTATAAATTTLVVGDAEQQYFTGSTTQTVVLPVTSTLVLGQSFTIINNSSGIVTVQSSGANTVKAMATLSWLIVTVIDTGVTTAAGWNVEYGLQTPSSGGISTVNTDSGNITPGSTVTFNAVSQAGTTVTFSAATSTVSLKVTDASGNTLVGSLSGSGSLAGNSNSGFGGQSLGSIGAASSNNAFGSQSLYDITTGGSNVAMGNTAGRVVTTGSNNVFLGHSAKGGASSSASEYNVYIGSGTGNSSNGSSNVYLNSAGAAESNALRIGYSTGSGTGQLNSAFISGIQTIVVTGDPVLVSTSNQLGVAASSAQFKKEIQDMATDSEAIMKLRPVTFQWNKDSSSGLADATDNRQYGLIAEEVDKAFPYLCSYDKEGAPFSVKYHELAAILLNEVQKLRREVDELKKGK